MIAEEDIVRRYARRSGFVLIGYRRVAIPIFRATTQVLMLERKALAPILEFILRALDCGMDTPEQIANLLGLELPIIYEGLHTLRQSDDIVLGPFTGGREHRLNFTQKGRQTLEAARLVAPQQMEYMLDIDGLTRKAIPFLGGRVVRPMELHKEGLVEIPTNPRRKPTFEEVSQQVRLHLRNLPQEEQESERDLLEVLAVSRIERLFRDDALMLIFTAENGKEIRAGFTINEVLSSEHEVAFAHMTKESQHLLLPESLSEDQQDALSFLAETADAEASHATTDRLRQEAERAYQEVTELTGRLSESDSVNEKAQLRDQLRAAEETLAQLQTLLDSIEVHGVEVYEHPKYLQEALEKAQTRLMIISPWIKAYVVNARFLRSLEMALDRGGEIYIGYGLDGENERENERDRQAITLLEQLARKHSHFHFTRLGDTHAKILVCDDWYISTSFNWLSFRGDARLPFRDERGTFVRIPGEVDNMFRSYSVRF